MSPKSGKSSPYTPIALIQQGERKAGPRIGVCRIALCRHFRTSASPSHKLDIPQPSRLSGDEDALV